MAEKTAKGRRRHVPTRTCIACRESQPKRELVRVVRTPEGAVVVDPTGKKAGRGAYICRRRSCWERALKKGALEAALKTSIGAADRALLETYIDSLPQEPAEPAPAVAPFQCERLDR